MTGKKYPVYSMKVRQTMDQANIEKLQSILEQFRVVYFDKTAPREQAPG